MPPCAPWRDGCATARRRLPRRIGATSTPPAPPAWTRRWSTACKLDAKAIETVALGCEQIAAMPDPIGEITGLREQPSGIRVGRMRVPIGVFAMIYESRPNVTIEAASLAIKSGNACILRGGSEAMQSNLALAALVRESLAEAGLPPDAVQLVGTTDRAAVGFLIAAPESVDLVIPRGGKSLIERIAREAKVPVMKHLDGNCHVYVDAAADLAHGAGDRRQRQDAEVQPVQRRRVAARAFGGGGAIPAGDRRGVRGQGDRDARRRRGAGAARRVPGASLVEATEADWSEEYLARDHQHQGGRFARRGDPPHQPLRLAPHRRDRHRFDHAAATRFLREVDSASVMVNVSTRFADGFEYGLGAEIGISTDKLHARGPVGLEGLTSQKWVVLGQGELAWRLIREAPWSCSRAARTRPSAWPMRSSATPTSRPSASTTASAIWWS